MWSSRLFWKLFLAYVLLNLLSAVAFVVIVSGWQEEQVIEQVKRRLHDSAVILRDDLTEVLPGGATPRLQQRVRRLGEQTGTRVTLVAMSGEVLADSQRADLAQVQRMENHKDRVELVQAQTNGQGSSERRSSTLGVPMLYLALRVGREGKPVGLVRTALPMATIQAEVAAVRRLIWTVALLVSLAGAVVTYWVVARIIRPVGTLTQAAEAIAGGDYQHRIFVPNHDELRTLAESFNRMSQRLDRRETQLRESGERLATVLGGMDEGVIAVDDREQVLLANAAAGKLLGFSPAETEGRALLEVVRNHTLHRAVADVLKAGGPHRLEMEFGEADRRVLAVNTTRLPGDPCPGVVLVLHEITELRRLESLRHEFVANVSHELKTPLSSIKAYAETLQQGAIDDPENKLKFVRQIEEQADRLHQLILDLLSLARIESGRQAFEIEAVTVSRVVDSCLASYRAAADAKGITISTKGAIHDLQVQADAEGLQEILDNLVDNAIKYTPEGGQVAVDWQPRDAAVVISVADTGIGIAAEHHARLFERFYRVDKARSRELGGTGLGLSIVKHLAQSFGGSVRVESEPGQGSTFLVTLPLA